MKKVLKALVAVVVLVIVIVLAALALHPLWLGPTVTAVAGAMGPKYTGTPVAIASCDINLYSGHFEISGFDLTNPEGCSEPSAVRLSTLKVDFNTLSALQDVIVVRSIDLSGLFVSYVKGASGKYNLNEIADNATPAKGGAEAEKQSEAAQPEPEKTESKPGKRVIIEKLSVGDIKVAVFGTSIPLLPGTIVLTDIGKKSNGATMEEAWTQVSEQVMKASGAAGENLTKLVELGSKYGKLGQELGLKGLEKGKELGAKGQELGQKALDSAKKLDVEGAKDVLKDTGKKLEDVGKGLKGLFK